MLFAHPLMLGLLVLAPVAAWASLRATWASPGQRWTSASLRAACVAAIVVALAGPMMGTNAAPTPATVVAIDVGPGVADAAIARAAMPAAPARVVAFSNRVEVLDDPAILRDPARLAALRARLSTPLWPDDPPSGGANLAAALRFVGTQFPVGVGGRARLFSTGLTTGHDGDAAAEAWRLATRGIAVDVTPLDVSGDALPATIVRHVELPASGRVGQTVRAIVEVDAANAGAVDVQLAAGDDQPIVASAILVPGVNRIAVDVPLTSAKLTPITARVTGSAEAATLCGTVDVAAASRVLVVEQPGDRGASSALGALLGDAAQVERIEPVALAARPLADVGAVVLSDVPADRLDAATQQRLRDAVLRGTGLLMTGVARSFGPGGYEAAPLAALLPVRMPRQVEKVDPSVALVLIIDSSGSMRGAPIDIAKEIARAAVSHLGPHDKVGVVEFYGGKRWAAPIASATNTSLVDRAIDRLNADGATAMYPAVEEAAFALSNVDAQRKHVLVLTDGGVEDAPFTTLARQMADDGIALSTVQCGRGEWNDGPTALSDIARAGRGRYYLVPDEFGLPDITLKQPSISPMSSVVDTPSAVRGGGDDPLVRGTDAWPRIDGHVRTVAKPTADVLLSTAGGDPLLVRWRYGSGFVAALTTQLGSTLSANADAQPAFRSLVRTLIRQLDAARPPPLTIVPSVRPAGIEVDVALADPRVDAATRPLQLTLSDGDGRVTRTAEVEPSALGHWNVLLPNVTTGVYRITCAVDRTQISGSAGVAVPAPRAVSARSADRELLARLASFAPAAPTPALAYVDLQKPLAAAAVVLLLLHVAARRWNREI